MTTQKSGAVLRAMLVALLVATPSMLLGAYTPVSREIAVLLAIILATGAYTEYRANYPTMLEFRDAPPINRIRFIALFAMVLLLSMICKHLYDPTSLTAMINGFGSIIGAFLDFPYSPVRLVLLSLPDGTDPQSVLVVRSMAGVVMVICGLSILTFYANIRLGGWPTGNGAFNVWINLPLFDPTAGVDVVQRLQREAWINVILGTLFPFFAPAFISLVTDTMGPIMSRPHMMIWVISLWAFIPAALVIRGMALSRVSDLIVAKRRRANDNARAEEFRTA